MGHFPKNRIHTGGPEMYILAPLLFPRATGYPYLIKQSSSSSSALDHFLLSLDKDMSLRKIWMSSVQFSRSVVSDTLWPHGLQRARLPCPSPTPGACSDSCPLNQCWHPTVSSSVIPFSSCHQSFPASGSFPVSQFFASGGQSIGTSTSASVLPGNIQGWFPLGLTGWISLESKGLKSLQHHSSKASIL